MRNPLAVLAPRRFGSADQSVPAPRRVPAPDTLPGVEFLEHGCAGEGDAQAPEVSVRGIDPRNDRGPGVASVHLAARAGGPCANTVQELLALGRPGDFRLQRLTFDVRALDTVLADRGGRAVLDQLVAAPTDRVTNAVFRAAMTGPGTSEEALPGDLDCDVRVVGEGDSVAGRCRVDLGRARLTITPLLTGSERLARRLAEARARPRDRAVRRCLEHALAVELTSVGLGELIAQHPDAPACDVPVR
ncbi:hypothetical protein LQ327_02780 [Actinomycetospora endophytica]|uniref:Uncharacterized protein n=1 Tax=Actinomycetospora endophytica TaxID=2291215 RepID=A0ABS8P261_9PSEU|nr:hypothetical protein [Actinomycetospora endophytica]MCD2192321.1 hypothetical protein [Actinomycetospora endophytica]